MGKGAQPAITARFAWIALLLAVAVVAVVWVAGATRERIVRNEEAQVLEAITALLPAGSFDNRPDQDRYHVLAPELGDEAPLPIYRARRASTPVAAVVTTVARQGYVGPIRLLVAISPQGTVLGVRLLEHRETPGVGDRIDPARSPWLRRFVDRSLDDPTPGGWAVRRDGGEFDQLAGATITSRAVVGALRAALLYFDSHRDEIFSHPGD